MPSFSYKAKDRSGQLITGTLEAADSHSAAKELREMGYWPIEIREERASRPSQSAGIAAFWTGVSLRPLTIFFRQLATMLQAGMPMSDALDSLGRQKGLGSKLQTLAARASEHVRSGEMLSRFLLMHPRVFSPIQIGLVKMGETSGMLDSMVDRIACYLERELEIRRKFSRITIYPKIIFVFILAFIFFFPNIQEIVNRGWPKVLEILIYNLVPFLLVCAFIYFLVKVLLLAPPIRYGWDYIKISFPILGMVSRKLAMARFTTALSVTYAAGVPLSQAVELGSEAVGNIVIEKALRSSVPKIRQGGQLSDVLIKTGQVPETVIGMMTTGEKTGSLDLVMDKVSEYYNSEAEVTLEKFGYFLFVALIIIAGIIVGKIAIDFYSSHYGSLVS